MTVDHRRYLLEKDLLYVFSEDGNIEYGREDIGFVNAGVRINIHATSQESRLYNVAGETALLGESVFSGSMVWGTDAVLVREDDMEILDVRILVRTDDGSLVTAEYAGVFAPGPRSFRQVVSEKPKLGSEQNPAEGIFFAAPRFRTGAAKYRWLNGRQCLAFGRVKFIESVARQATLDVWLMD
jgi:hypothetical protein